MSGSGVPRYARGSRAWGECARSGKRMLLHELVEDPLTGLLVAPDWAEPPLMRPATNIIDGVALLRPAPQLDQVGDVIYPGNVIASGGDPARPLFAKYETGRPTVVVT